MLEFAEKDENARLLAIYYANKIGDDFVTDFMSSRVSISTPEQADKVTRVFWEMVDLSVEDNESEISIEGVTEIEFWMYKLFNKVSGYISKNGFKEQWEKATNEVKSE